MLCVFLNNVTVNNTKLLNIAMEMQQLVPFALLLRYKIFHTVVNSMNILRPSFKVPDTFLQF
jgi:hypothetical protein